MPRAGDLRLTAVRLPPDDAAGVIVAEWEKGRAVLPLDPDAPPDQVRRLMTELKPTHLVDGSGRTLLGGGVPVDAGVAAVVATSGTTADPRGVELTWDGLQASAAAVGAALDVDSDRDRWLCCLPLHHVAGLAVLGRGWAAAVPVTVVRRLESQGSASGETLLSIVPTLLHRALAGTDEIALLRSFRRVLVGGAPLSGETRTAAESAGIAVVETYGLTETWGGVVHDGHPLPGVEVRIDTTEIQLRAPMTMRAYRRRPVDTAAAFTADGWLRTGDGGDVGPDGRLTVTDRLRDLILTGGVSVSPFEVEAVLSRHPGVSEVCVAGRPDPEWGERVVAFVVAAQGSEAPSVEELRAFAASHLSGAQLPREVVAVRFIPRTPGGKPLRRLLRAGFRSGPLA